MARRALSVEDGLTEADSRQQTATMLFMVIERFKDSDGVKQRFAEKGRMMPDGVRYVDSWIETNGKTCYQIMEADRQELLAEWTKNWEDLVDFDIIPVLTSAEFNFKDGA